MTSLNDLLGLLDEVTPHRDDDGSDLTHEDDARRVDWFRFTSRDGIGAETWAPQFPEEWIEAVRRSIESSDVPGGHEGSCGDPSTNPGGSFHRCAWYVPLHRSSSAFGIYIRESCIFHRMVRVAGEFGRQFGRQPPTLTLLQAMYRGAAFELFLHEQFHHKVESLGFRLLIVQNLPKYLDYSRTVYQPVFGTNDCLEEALANADAYRRLRERTYRQLIGSQVLESTRSAFRASWRRSPGGYNQAGKYVSERDYASGLATLKAQVDEGSLHPARVWPWRISANFAESIFPITSHIYSVFPVGGTPVMPIFR